MLCLSTSLLGLRPRLNLSLEPCSILGAFDLNCCLCTKQQWGNLLADEWEVRALPICYAIPNSYQLNLIEVNSSLPKTYAQNHRTQQLAIRRKCFWRVFVAPPSGWVAFQSGTQNWASEAWNLICYTTKRTFRKLNIKFENHKFLQNVFYLLVLSKGR